MFMSEAVLYFKVKMCVCGRLTLWESVEKVAHHSEDPHLDTVAAEPQAWRENRRSSAWTVCHTLKKELYQTQFDIQYTVIRSEILRLSFDWYTPIAIFVSSKNLDILLALNYWFLSFFLISNQWMWTSAASKQDSDIDQLYFRGVLWIIQLWLQEKQIVQLFCTELVT